MRRAPPVAALVAPLFPLGATVALVVLLLDDPLVAEAREPAPARRC